MHTPSLLRGRTFVAAGIVLAVCGSAMALPINGRVPVKTYTVGPAGTAAPDATIAQDFQFANAIWNQVGIQFDNTGDTFIEANTPAGAGQWTDYQVNNILSTAARQQTQGFAYFIVPTNTYANGTTTLAETWSQEDVGNTINDPNSAATTTVKVRSIATRATRGGTDTVPHEFGHMLSNQYRWRRSERPTNTNAFHSNTNNDLMFPNVQNPALNVLFPTGTKAQVGHNIGQQGATGSTRVPLITDCYNNGNAGGSSTGNAMFSAVNRDAFQYSMNQNNSTITTNANWGETTSVALPTFPSGSGTHTYTVDETARRGPGLTETFSFFITSTNGWSLGGDLIGNGFYFNAFGINTLDGAYTGIVPNSVQIRIWTDILFAGTDAAGTGITAAQGGAGEIVDPSKYTAFGNLSGGALSMEVNFAAADASLLAGYRDMQITFAANWLPAPGASALLGMAGLLAARRRRR